MDMDQENHPPDGPDGAICGSKKGPQQLDAGVISNLQSLEVPWFVIWVWPSISPVC